MSVERVFADSKYFRVVFVCTGNICRSPMAEAVIRALAQQQRLGDRIRIASAGIGDFHVGETADPRTVRVLERAGYDVVDHRAKQFQHDWFDLFDLIVALDRGQERVLRAMAPPGQRSKVKLLMQFHSDPDTFDVPDPYYSDERFFVDVLHQIESATRKLFRQIEPALRLQNPVPEPS